MVARLLGSARWRPNVGIHRQSVRGVRGPALLVVGLLGVRLCALAGRGGDGGGGFGFQVVDRRASSYTAATSCGSRTAGNARTASIRVLVITTVTPPASDRTDLLQRCVDAVAQLPVNAIVTTGPSIDPASVTAGANTRVVRYAPHAQILPSASLVITHAGAGTTMAALGHGVPLLCTPMGRDQFFNADRVQALGAGRMLKPDADSDAIALAAKDMLAGSRFTAEAKRMADAIGGYGGAARAATALEALA